MKDLTNHMQGLVLDNRYRVLEKIGIGGMADVYKGEDTLLGRLVAIKVLHQNFASDDDFVARFKREAQAAGKLSHPNIVNMYDVGFDQGYHYIVMEYVEGETLKEFIRRHQHVSVDMAVKFTIAIAEGLEHAHAMGIVHCDIKPHNVMITPQGRVKVTDFGIARAMNSNNTLMYTNSIMGSAHYLSPEQAGGKSINGSTDIYSLGVVLYEMLTGRVPYEGDTPISVAIKHVREPLTPPTRINPSIPPLLEAAVMKALAKNPEDRFPTISDMISDLRLSQGFVNSKSGRMVPHDFATQVLPTVEDPTLQDIGYEEEEPESVSFIAKVAQLPKKYIVLGSVLIFVLAFLWAFFSFGNFWSNASVTVPNVVGKQVSVAQHILEDNQLRYKINKVASDKAAGIVISQLPPPGESVKEQYPIVLVVSSGQGDISIPNLLGLTLDQAKEQLSASNLKVGNIIYKSDADQPDGVVIDQSPRDGNAVSGTAIDITVNRKQESSITVPNVIGSTLKDAKATLTAAKLSYTIDGPTDDNAIVANQNPAAASTVDGSTKIILKTAAAKNDQKESSNVTRGSVDITVPAGPKHQTIKIVVVDDNGSHVAYEGNGEPGEKISRNVQGVGTVHIEVYINGNLVQDSSL